MANRIYFANQQLAFRRDGGSTWTAAHGVQSVAVTTTFNLEQAFELGQLAIYENIEGVPDIELTATKVLDGYPLLYHLSTSRDSGHATAPTLAGRSNAKCVTALGIWPDTADSAGAGGAAASTQMECSGMFASSISYSFPTEDNFTEDITLVGNDKGWKSATTTAIDCDNPGWAFAAAAGSFGSNDDAPQGTGGVQRRENLAFNSENARDAGGPDYTLLPRQIPGVSTSGWMRPQNAGNEVHLQSISISTDLGREELFELGTRQPYARVVTFPIEVTCDIEVLSLSGDMINAFSDGCIYSTDQCTGISDNLQNESIRLATCEGTRIFLGDKNKLASVNYGGGDAGGGNVTVTYSYTTFNDCTVMHPQDPDASGTEWWDARASYLTSAIV